MYLYLLTNPLTNIAGVYEITVDRICFDTGYNRDTIEKVLKRFEESGKVYRYKGHIILPSWPRHQKWQKRSKIKEGIVAILENLDPEILGFMKKIGYSYPIDTLSVPYTYGRNYSEFDSDTEFDSRTPSAQGAGSPDGSEETDEEDPFNEVADEAPPEVPEHVQSINDTLFSAYGRFMNGEEIDLAKELVKKHYPGRVSKELRKVAKNREPPKAPLHYIHSYLKDQNTRGGGKPAAAPVNADELEEVEF